MKRSAVTIARMGQRTVRVTATLGLILLLALVLATVVNTATTLPASAADTGLKSPSANSNAGWFNPQDAYSSNNVRASANSDSDIVQFYNFSITVPSGSTIDGIQVNVEGYRDWDRQADISLSWDNGTTYTTGSGTGVKRTNMPGTNPWDEAVRTFGGATDNWGRTWLSTDFSNENYLLK
jgi:hypothetical protein